MNANFIGAVSTAELGIHFSASARFYFFGFVYPLNK